VDWTKTNEESMTTTDHEDRCASRGCKVTLTGRGYITDRDGSGVPMPAFLYAQSEHRPGSTKTLGISRGDVGGQMLINPQAAVA
jgi:hypothetical protein